MVKKRLKDARMIGISNVTDTFRVTKTFFSVKQHPGACVSFAKSTVMEAHLSNRVTFLWKEPKAAGRYRTAVSLHGHTSYSKEGLRFIAEYAARNPLLRAALAMKARRAQIESAITLDFERAYWSPPLPPLSAFRVERHQIERGLGLNAIISLTDHDTIEAPLLLRVLPEAEKVPISVEWSVPYRETTLHVGVHNLPFARAENIMSHLTEYTKDPVESRLRDILGMLHAREDILVVLNHPLWDLGGVGPAKHAQILHGFLAEFGMFVHALELGGLRSWDENQAVLELAERWNQPVIGGGDRHGAEPSAVLNLTNAEEFSQFVGEVRQKRRCHVLVMPQYCEPQPVRVLQSLLDAIREYPEYADASRKWDQRVFHPDRHGVSRPLKELWKKPPGFIEAFFRLVRLLETDAVRKAAQTALARPAHEMQFFHGRGREIRSQ